MMTFDSYIKSILDVGADGIVVDTIKITNQQGKYKGKHAITVIHDVRCAYKPILYRKGK